MRRRSSSRTARTGWWRDRRRLGTSLTRSWRFARPAPRSASRRRTGSSATPRGSRSRVRSKSSCRRIRPLGAQPSDEERPVPAVDSCEEIGDRRRKRVVAARHEGLDTKAVILRQLRETLEREDPEVREALLGVLLAATGIEPVSSDDLVADVTRRRLHPEKEREDVMPTRKVVRREERIAGRLQDAPDLGEEVVRVS